MSFSGGLGEDGAAERPVPLSSLPSASSLGLLTSALPPQASALRLQLASSLDWVQPTLNKPQKALASLPVWAHALLLPEPVSSRGVPVQTLWGLVHLQSRLLFKSPAFPSCRQDLALTHVMPGTSNIFIA